MRLSIKTKQVAGVTVIVGLTVGAAERLVSLVARAHPCSTKAARAPSCSRRAIYQRARDVVQRRRTRSVLGLADDGGLQSILQASLLYGQTSLYAAIVDINRGVIIAHSDPSMRRPDAAGRRRSRRAARAGPIAQARAIYTPGGKHVRVQQAARCSAATEVRVDPRRRLDAAHPDGSARRRSRTPLYTDARRAHRRHAGGDAARAGRAAADPRDPQRPRAPRPRRARRQRRPARRRGVSAISATRSKPSPRGSPPIARSWPASGDARIRRRSPRRRRRAVRARRRAALREPGDARGVRRHAARVARRRCCRRRIRTARSSSETLGRRAAAAAPRPCRCRAAASGSCSRTSSKTPITA